MVLWRESLQSGFIGRRAIRCIIPGLLLGARRVRVRGGIWASVLAVHMCVSPWGVARVAGGVGARRACAPGPAFSLSNVGESVMGGLDIPSLALDILTCLKSLQRSSFLVKYP